MDHTLSFCTHPDLVAARAWLDGHRINLDSIDQNVFPAWLRAGMPKAMANTISGTFWGTPLSEINLRTSIDRKNLGIRDHGKVTKLQGELDEVLCRMGVSNLCARQVAAKMRGTVGSGGGMGIQPPWCDADPPAEVSSYSDGSVSNPTQKSFALGGSGVWHKGRNEQEEPITEYEMHFLKMCFTADGCEGLLRYVRHDVDSYRTEVLGVLAAMGSPSGVHTGLDNHSAFEDVLRIISKPFAETVPRKPWSLVID